MRSITCDKCGQVRVIPITREPDTKSVMAEFKTISLDHQGKHYQDLCLACHETFTMMVQDATREAQLFKERKLLEMTGLWASEEPEDPHQIKGLTITP